MNVENKQVKMIVRERRISAKMLIKFQTYSIDVPLYLSVFSSFPKVLLPFFEMLIKSCIESSQPMLTYLRAYLGLSLMVTGK